MVPRDERLRISQLEAVSSPLCFIMPIVSPPFLAGVTMESSEEFFKLSFVTFASAEVQSVKLSSNRSGFPLMRA